MSAFDELWPNFEQFAGDVLTQELSSQAPVVTGQLAASMRWEDQSGTLTVGSDDPRGPIAAYVARGTKPHDIRPVNAQFLHFFGSDGGEVFTKLVHHPGTVANPFHVRAWEAQRQNVTWAFHETMGKGVTLHYLNPWKNRTIG